MTTPRLSPLEKEKKRAERETRKAIAKKERVVSNNVRLRGEVQHLRTLLAATFDPFEEIMNLKLQVRELERELKAWRDA